LYFYQPKQPKTRESRVEKSIPKILSEKNYMIIEKLVKQ